MASVDIVSAVLRALGFIALFQAAGLALFLSLFGQRLTVSAPVLRRTGVVSALIAIVFVAAHYGLEAARMGGALAAALDTSLQAFVLHSPAAVALAWRLAGLALIVTGLSLRDAAGITLSVIGVVLTVSAFTFTGHTTADPQRWALSLLLMAHLLIVAFWFGALAPLHLATVREPPTVASALTEAFSKVALWIVPFLFLAGFALAACIVKSLDGLRTPYGQLLLAKVAGFALLMVFAALNKWRLGPAIADGNSRALSRLRNSLLIEYGLIAAVLCVTAVLTSFYSPESTGM